MAVSKFSFDAFEEKGMEGGGGYLPSDLFWLLKSELELSLPKPMSPSWSLYEYPFHKNHIYPQGITYISEATQ